MNPLLKVHPEDNIIVALQNFSAGEEVIFDRKSYLLREDIPVKHKFAAQDFSLGERVIMYGVQIGRVVQPIQAGERISVENVKHAADAYQLQDSRLAWQAPDISRFQDRTFEGYHRPDGKIGTRNYWIVFPLVFCENRNIEAIEEAMLEGLGYPSGKKQGADVKHLIELYQNGASDQELLAAKVYDETVVPKSKRIFPNIDGIKFLTHDGGCGGIRQDSEALCRLLAGYLANPNVAGATVLSLGCQHAQYQLLAKAIEDIPGATEKPLVVLEQQKSKSEKDFISTAIKRTFLGLTKANQINRQPAPLSKLVLGLECGGSDGFSGITANPALGHTSDLLVALGGTTILSEFPELNGVEQELINRCPSPALARKFSHLMEAYSQRAEADGSGFDMNPSPGNIRDGLITDAMKSAGAAKKGGTSPVRSVLDYTEQPKEAGLALLCTPGNDVESTTGLAGSGANLIVFTTGLGTPTGNPIAPTVKFSTNSMLYERMPDLIDIDAGTIVSGADSVASKGEELLELLIEVASGRQWTKAELLGQDDFIPWKRGISL
ncbi:MAG TPA: altronate dehydratase family protein [Saprospiraceae bacterium]|nr:altronate dehydratase family protein [Saprospiraceae bacterium]